MANKEGAVVEIVIKGPFTIKLLRFAAYYISYGKRRELILWFNWKLLCIDISNYR